MKLIKNICRTLNIKILKSLLFTMLLVANVSFAKDNSNGPDNDAMTDHWNLFVIVKQQIETGTTPLRSLDGQERKQFISLFKKPKKQFSDNLTNITDKDSIFKGDFHNDGSVIYVVSNDRAKYIYFYQLQNSQLVELNFNSLFDKIYGSHTNLDGKDLRPFVKDGKTYLRFEQVRPFDHIDHDPNLAIERIYLWHDDKIDDIGPDFTGAQLNNLLKPCNMVSLREHMKNFTSLYSQKNYSAAYQTLNEFSEGCKAYNYEESASDFLELKNSMLITLIHLNDKPGCTALMNDIKQSKEYKSYTFYKGCLLCGTQTITPQKYVPSLLQRIDFNFSKCEALK